MLKRGFDILAAALGVLLLSPFLIVVALLVAVTSRGGVFFAQIRVGRGGVPFTMYKFRSMRPARDAEDGRFDLGDQSRVTAVGRVLRRTKLDEFPQLFNVLAGSMSLVGPRPEVERWTREYPDRWRIAHTVRPGMTDRASIEFRDEEKLLRTAADPEACYRDVILPRKLDSYEAYARRHPFWGDVRILMQTGVVVFLGGESRADERQSPS